MKSYIPIVVMLALSACQTSGSTSRAMTDDTSAVVSSGQRDIVVAWEGFLDSAVGTLNWERSGSEGSARLKISENGSSCMSTFKNVGASSGLWSIACGGGHVASGSMTFLGKDRGAIGVGLDGEDHTVSFKLMPPRGTPGSWPPDYSKLTDEELSRRLDVSQAIIKITDAAPLSVAEFEKAVRIIAGAAERGDRSAQSTFGMMYMGGFGLQADLGKSAKWLRKAAEQDDPQSQLSLGALYYEGQGVNRDHRYAMYWFMQAAAPRDLSGLPEAMAKSIKRIASKAQEYVGTMYGAGQGVPRSEAAARLWFRLSMGQ